jgi:hypothetical protein
MGREEMGKGELSLTLKEALLSSRFLLISVNFLKSPSALSAFFNRTSRSCFSLAS